jgi:hypothetical protein
MICAKVRLGSIAPFWPSADHFRSSPGNGHRQADPARPKSAMKRHGLLFDHLVRASVARARDFGLATVRESLRGYGHMTVCV